MVTEEKQKINVWIPGSLWKQIGSLGYESPTKATIAAFEALVLKETKGSNQEVLGSSQEEVRKLQEEIGRYQEKVKDLEARPDPVSFAQLQAKFEGLDMILKEKDKRIESLENDLKKADLREEDLKQMHNNYMLQVQSLINARALTPSGSTRKEEKPKQEKKENRPAQKEDINTASHNPWKGKEATIQKTCKFCKQPFLARNPKNEYCSPAHRKAYNKEKKQASGLT